MATCTPSDAFFTRPITIRTAAVKRCPGMGSCVGETCALTKADTQVAELTAYNTLTGATRCEEACSCITCGCLSCQGACLFYRTKSVKTRTTGIPMDYTVHPIGGAQVTVKLTTSSTDETFRVRLAPGETATKRNLTITLMKQDSAVALQPVVRDGRSTHSNLGRIRSVRRKALHVPG
uniref:Phlebovirus_G2 domain-containing protein n=1 Tax=Steinernema glaseri TaxID=37863 RepID=A0A1I7YR90_9BILA